MIGTIPHKELRQLEEASGSLTSREVDPNPNPGPHILAHFDGTPEIEGGKFGKYRISPTYIFSFGEFLAFRNF